MNSLNSFCYSWRVSAFCTVLSLRLGTANGHHEHPRTHWVADLSPPKSTGLVTLQPYESRTATKWWQLLSSTTLRVKKEKLWLQSVFYARNPEFFNLTEGLASLHSWQCALTSSPPFLLALFPVPAAVLVYYRVSPPGWRNSSARKNPYLFVRDALCQPLAQGTELGNC